MKPAASPKSGTFAFHLFLLVIVLGMISACLALPFRARQLPLLIGAPTALLLLFSLLGELKPGLLRRFAGRMGGLATPALGDAAGPMSAAFAESELPPFRCLLIGGAWFSLLFVLVLYMGFLAATLLFIPCFLLVLARYPWWQVSLYTAILFLTEWYGFDVLLGLGLWKGFDVLLGLELWKGAAPEMVRHFIGGGVLPPFF